jgi:hypothetical protein
MVIMDALILPSRITSSRSSKRSRESKTSTIITSGSVLTALMLKLSDYVCVRPSLTPRRKSTTEAPNI